MPSKKHTGNWLYLGLVTVVFTIATLPVAAQDPAIRVTSSGDVGIGTATPSASLHAFRSDGTAQIVVEETTGTAAPRSLFTMRNNGGSYFSLENTNTGGTWWFVHENSAPNRFIITSSASPGPKFVLTNSGDLTVAGSITTATQTIPDYVFEPDYELMPLDELEAFVEREKHLPNVPSDTEIQAAGGINMSDMQIRLLEKVEELTLYTLEQQKTIREQAAALSELTERLASLEGRRDSENRQK